MIKVLHIITRNKGGAAKVAINLSKSFNRSNYNSFLFFEAENKIFTRRDLHELCKSEKSSDIIPRLKYSNPKKFYNRRDIKKFIEKKFGKHAGAQYDSIKSLYKFSRTLFPNLYLIIRIIKKYEIDIVHTHNDISHGKLHILAAELCRLPCVVHFHRFSKVSSFDKLFSMLADEYVYVSRDIEKWFLSQGLPEHKSNIIHNGINPSNFHKEYDSIQIRNELNCSHKDFIIAIIGRIDSWKGHDVLLKAVLEVLQKFPNIKCLICGEIGRAAANQKYLHDLKLFIQSNHIADKISFTGFRSDISRILTAVDLLVNASSSPEPFGLSIIEAMAAGKPVIATATGGPLDIIDNGVDGILVPCKDYRSLADAIIYLISEPAIGKRLGIAASHKISKKFNLKRQVKEVEMIYAKLPHF